MSKTPLRLRPSVVIAAQDRSRQLRLTVSGYAGILISNYEQRPERLAAEPAEAKLARVNIAMSWRGDLRTRAKRLAKAAGLNVNAFVEALIARDQREGGNLTIIARP